VLELDGEAVTKMTSFVVPSLSSTFALPAVQPNDAALTCSGPVHSARRLQSETGERYKTTRGRLNHPERVEAMDEALALLSKGSKLAIDVSSTPFEVRRDMGQ
jgi:hypothetical protein